MDLQPIKFLGATVYEINNNLGWNDSPSTLTVSVVEDKNDRFTRPPVGSYANLTATSFEGNDWYFGGIIQNWSEKVHQGGNSTFQISIIDPRELLDGVQLILNGYAGNITVPNVLNIYGYLKNKNIYRVGGYRTSLIKKSILELTSSITPYGSTIKLAGVQYLLNLHALPILPDYHTITDESMSLLDFIRLVCDDANHEYFFSVIPGTIPTLALNTIDRNIPPSSNSISTFLRNNMASAKQAGYEFNNQFTSKFLMGGRIAKMFYQNSIGGEDNDFETNPWENSVWPYWGIDNNKNAIIGEGINDDHTFTVDVKHLSLGFDSYTTDVGELRAALDSQDSWESYLSLRDQNMFKIDPQGNDSDVFRYPKENLPKLLVLQLLKDGNVIENRNIVIEGSKKEKEIRESIADRSHFFRLSSIQYTHSRKKNPHFGKATNLKISGLLTAFVGAWLYQESTNKIKISTNKIKSLNNIDPNASDLDGDNLSGIPFEIIQYRKERLYVFIRNIAEEYYGKQFMVRLPFIISNRDDSNEIYVSYEPTDAGFIDEETFPLAWQNNLLPIPFDNGYLIDPRLMYEDGRVYSYVRFDSITNYDYSDIPDDCLVISPMFDSVFIKCELDIKFVYQNYNLLYSPRAIVKLPGRVVSKQDSESFGFHIIGKWLYPIESKNNNDKATDNIISIIKESAGADNINLWSGKNAVMPSLVSIALLSQERYGPWYKSGAEGKTEYEEDDSLVPWNFVSWQDFNEHANSRILQSINFNQHSEFGSISVAGIPNVMLGQSLIDQGPIVTNIAINYDTEFTTTYNMNTWSVNPYKLSKTRNDYISRLRKKQQDIRKNLLAIKTSKTAGVNSRVNLAKTIADLKRKADKGIHSSHDIVFGQRNENGYDVVIQPMYNTKEQISDSNRSRQAVSSLNNLLIPFGGNMQNVRFPPSDLKIYPNGRELFPYKEGSNVGILSSESNNKINLNTKDPSYNWDSVKGLALRGPVMLSSWGYDISGFPIPGSGLTQEQRLKLLEQAQEEGGTIEEIEERYEQSLESANEKARKTFHQDYLDPFKSDWPTSPIDFRYDDVRKLWTMGGYSFLAKVIDTGETEDKANTGPSTVKCRRYTVEFDNQEIGEEVRLKQTNFIFLAGNFRRNEVVKDTLYLIHNIDGYYLLDTQHTFLDYE